MGGLIPIIIIAVIAYIIFKPGNSENKKNNEQNQGKTINHSIKKGDDFSTGFFRAFGEKTGSAFGCFVIILIVLIVFIIIALSGVREIGRAFNVINWKR